MAVIEESEEFVYISTESFTDTDIIPFLIKNSIKNKVIKILTASKTQDFDERIREQYPRLLANDIELRKPNDPLHAKLLITDKRLILSSVNLNKMNLGYAKNKLLWRGNTETITVESDRNIVQSAKTIYENIFSNSLPLLNYLAEKEEDYAISIFTIYGVKPDKDVRKLFSQVIVKSDIKSKKNLYQIGKFAFILVNKFHKGKNTVKIIDFLCAMALYYLSDRKHTERELKEKLSDILPNVNIKFIVDILLKYKLVEKEDDFVKINIETLLGG